MSDSDNGSKPRKVSVIGLGYVGLPLAIALAHHLEVVGFDLKVSRIEALRAAHDATGEVPDELLAATTMKFTSDERLMRGSDVFIITVPTPVDQFNEPDLMAVKGACQSIGRVIARGATVVLESTVYPGVTEGFCKSEIESTSGLEHGVDFSLGYSPERMNPGDKAHTLASITKVVAGDSPRVASMLADLYGRVTNGNVFIARDIRTAEAAKVIENAQRDINIAFINEVTMIFGQMGLSIYDVLDAARTKWNFLPFIPGLVGGHCIGVDPFYLAHKAKKLGLSPDVILAGRRINDGMGSFIAHAIDKQVARQAKVLVLGLTFKENVPDLRNSKVVDLVRALQVLGHRVEVHDPVADPDEALAEYGIKLVGHMEGLAGYDAVVGAVPHRAYTSFGMVDLTRLLAEQGLLADVKGMWRQVAMPKQVRRWSL